MFFWCTACYLKCINIRLSFWGKLRRWGACREIILQDYRPAFSNIFFASILMDNFMQTYAVKKDFQQASRKQNIETLICDQNLSSWFD